MLGSRWAAGRSADGETAVVTEPDFETGPVAFLFDLADTAGTATATVAGFMGAEEGTPGGQGAVYEYTNPVLQTYGDGNDNYETDFNSVALYDGLDPSGIGELGQSVAVAPNSMLIAGAPTSSVGSISDRGAVVHWSWGDWPADEAPSAPSAYGGSSSDTVLGLAAGDELGDSVASNPNATVVAAGEPYAVDPDVVSDPAAGAVEILSLAGGASGSPRHTSVRPRDGSCEAIIVGPLTGAVAGEGYGTSVAVSGDGSTVLVGAPSTGYRVGIDSPPGDTISEYAYVEYAAAAAWGCNAPGALSYTEDPFAGTTQQYDNQPFGTYFGQSVAMAGNESDAFVGAPMDAIEDEQQGVTYVLKGPGPPTSGTISGTPPAATLGSSYDFSFSVGGIPAPTVSESGALPPGLSLTDGNAGLSGTPTTVGSYPMAFTATNSVGSQTDSVDVVVDAATTTVTSVSPAQGTTSGGTAVVIDGTALAGATAVDFGSVAASSFTVLSSTIIDATAPAGKGSVQVVVNAPAGTSTPSSGSTFACSASDVRITTASLPKGTKGMAYTAASAAKAKSGSVSWKSTKLPAGLTMTSKGVISGKPTKVGSFTVVFTARSGVSNDTRTLTITVAA